jgi:hypothetical protein
VPAPKGLRAAVATTADEAPAGAVAPQPFTAAYLQQAYDLTYLSATGGISDTVAVVDAYDDPTADTDLATFRQANGLPPCSVANGCLRKVNEQGETAPLPPADNDWSIEEATDLAAVSALCPNCHLLLVEAESPQWFDLITAMQTAAGMGARQISDSWTSIAGSQPPGQLTFPGVAVVAASGDSGYHASGNEYPAAATGVTAAGGTSLEPALTVGNSRGFSETAWSGAGAGCVTDAAKPVFQSSISCPGRGYADVSADADPETGLGVYQSGAGGWVLVGGTSLSAPLIAGFEAITGVDGTTPAWAYTDRARLNDPMSVSSGGCDPTLAELCSPSTGYEGPTGAGSISGQVVSGAPGIGAGATGGAGYVQSVDAGSAALSGGVYPNGLDTAIWWQYGPSATYGEATAPVEIGSGTAIVPVAGGLIGLMPSTTYHYRLVAHNGRGTSYGYDYTLTTANAPPGSSQPPVVVPRTGATASSAGALPTGPRVRLSWRATVRTPLLARVSGSGRPWHLLAFRWQIRRRRRWVLIRGARSPRFVPRSCEVGHRLRVTVTYRNAEGEHKSASASTAPVVPAAARRLTRRLAPAGAADVHARARRRPRSPQGR